MATEDQLAEVEKLSETLHKFRTLLSAAGWDALAEIAKVQASRRRGERVYKPLGSMDEVLAQQFELGEASGIELVLALPTKIVEDSAAQLKELQDTIGVTDEGNE